MKKQNIKYTWTEYVNCVFAEHPSATLVVLCAPLHSVPRTSLHKYSAPYFKGLRQLGLRIPNFSGYQKVLCAYILCPVINSARSEAASVIKYIDIFLAKYIVYLHQRGWRTTLNSLTLGQIEFSNLKNLVFRKKTWELQIRDWDHNFIVHSHFSLTRFHSSWIFVWSSPISITNRVCHLVLSQPQFSHL